MSARSRFLAIALLAPTSLSCAHAPSERPVAVAVTAPRDAPYYATTDTAMARVFALLEPCRLKAIAAWPGARARFLAGLPSNQTLFVTTRLHDSRGHMEQVFVAVDGIQRDSASGRLWSEITVVHGFRRGQRLIIPESEIVDWMISKPDGSEEGNWMGKFADAGFHETSPGSTCG
jgi:hypothetical protein